MIDEAAVRRTPKRRTLVVAGLAVVVLAVVGWVLGQRPDPRDLVVDYLDAIAAGDVEAANALAADGVWPDAGLPAVGSMDDAGLIGDVQVDGDGRTTSVTPLSGASYEALGFDVTYEVGGARVSDTVFVERTGGSWLRPEYRIRDSLAQPVRLVLSAPLTGVDVTAGSSTTTASTPVPDVTDLPLYPGDYRLVPRAGLDLAPVALTVGSESPSVVLEVAPEELREVAGPQMLRTATEALTRCLESAVEYASCDGGLTLLLDFPSPDGATWRIDGDVVLADQPAGQSWPATATVAATWTDDTGTAREQRFDVTGGVVVTSVSTDGVDLVALWSRVALD